jgi:hypothetical protein
MEKGEKGGGGRKLESYNLWVKVTTYGRTVFGHHIKFGPKKIHMTIFERM